MLNTENQKSDYLKSVFKETYIVDIVERNRIRNTAELEELLNFLSSSIGALTNPKKIADTFTSVKNLTISQETVKKYLEYLCDAFLIRGVLL